ncbi:MAG: hypothetical protein ACXWZZ_07060, partial [Solirubrobacteraceae bacterium]
LYFLGYSSLFMLAPAAQARRDGSARDRLAGAAGAGAARAKRKADERRAQRVRSHRRRVARRVAARRAAVRRNARLRRQHRAVCFKSHGRTVCRVPRPLVCVKHHDVPTVCRPRKP